MPQDEQKWLLRKDPNATDFKKEFKKDPVGFVMSLLKKKTDVGESGQDSKNQEPSPIQATTQDSVQNSSKKEATQAPQALVELGGATETIETTPLTIGKKEEDCFVEVERGEVEIVYTKEGLVEL